MRIIDIRRRNTKMKVAAISGNGLRGFFVCSLLVPMLSIKVVRYSNSPTIITDTLTIDQPTFLKASWKAIENKHMKARFD